MWNDFVKAVKYRFRKSAESRNPVKIVHIKVVITYFPSNNIVYEHFCILYDTYEIMIMIYALVKNITRYKISANSIEKWLRYGKKY